MVKRLVFIFVLVMAVVATGSAQQITVSGHVKADGEPLVGASVTVKNTGQGVITNIDGAYSIRVNKNATLVVSYVGYHEQEVPVRGRTSIDVALLEDNTVLEDVVITVPYGTAKKSTFTGSAGYVGKETLGKELVSNVSKALQGTVPGLQSFSSTGQPGSDASIYIRGVGSVNASSTPLYVVDGVPYDGSISSIAPSDIESITVLKDAASAALYGSRAANGVIMIVTKQGSQDNKTKIELNAKYGWSSRARADYDQLTTNQYFELYWEALRNERLDNGATAEEAAKYASQNLTGRFGINPYGTAYPEPVGTDGKLVSGATPLWDDDWDEALRQNAHYQEYNLNISGGGKNSQYFISGSYLDDQGAYIESSFKRYNFRSNVSTSINSWLKAGLNISGTHSNQQYPKQDDSTTSNVILFARNLRNFYPIYERDPTTGEYILDEAGNRQWDFGLYRPSSYSRMNLVASMPLDKSDYMRDALNLRSFLQAQLYKDLSYKVTLNYDLNNRTNHSYVNPELGTGSTTGGSVSKQQVTSTTFTINNVLDYSHTFANVHNLHALVGQEYYEYNTSNFGGTRANVIANGYYEPDAASVLADFYGNSDAYKLLSWFGTAEYNYDSRYYLSASVRTDGSSRFAPEKRWGTFWSVGGSWRISKEAFLADQKDWLYNLSLRTSYGAQGNDNVGYYAYQALYGIRNNLGESGAIATRLATPNLSWETNYNFNVALDFGFWGNRLNGTIEFFHRRSKDLLFSLDLVPSSGFSSMNANIGALRNVGWEFQIQGLPVKTKDWEWKLGVNATTYKNTITSLPADEMWSGNKKWVKGGSLYDWYLIEWAGINPENGKPQWYGVNEDGSKYVTDVYSSLTNADKVKVGTSLPTVTGGIQSDLKWKDLSLALFFSYSIGGKIYNGDKVSLYGHGPSGATAWSADMLNRWTPENRDTDFPRLTTGSLSGGSWTSASSRFLFDRSYLKLKNVQFSYSLPKTFINKANFDAASVFVAAENLFTLTEEQGLDPEQNIGGTTYYRYPSMKTISIGLNVKF